MGMNQIPFATSETDLAVYLIQSGFNLLGIQYEPRSNGRKRGIFIFEGHPKIDEYKGLFESGQAVINLADLDKRNEIKSSLLDRIMQELP